MIGDGVLALSHIEKKKKIIALSQSAKPVQNELNRALGHLCAHIG